MSYPNLPNNRLIVEGVDLSERFKMVLLDGYTLTPPTPKTYVVDIPGGNGKLDLTESLLGDTAYNNRSMTFTFAVIDIENFERVKTEISNFLHGRAFDFQMTMDPDYIYHGRFTINSCTHNAYNIGIIGQIVIGIDAEPFKHKPTQVRRACAIGGNTFFFESGRERVCPVIETDSWLRIIYNGKKIDIAQGTWTVNDLSFKEGSNEVYMNSFPIHNLTWGELKRGKLDLTDDQVELGGYHISAKPGETGLLVESSMWTAYKLPVKPNSKYQVTVNTGTDISESNGPKILCAIYNSIVNPTTEMNFYLVANTEILTTAEAHETHTYTITTPSDGAYMVIASDGVVHSTYELLDDSEGTTWKQFGAKPLYKWYKSKVDSSIISNGWESIAGKTWSAFTNSKWSNVTSNLDTAAANVKDIYLKYEWGDL